MRQEKLMDAMEFVDDRLLESAADSMDGKKKTFSWIQLAGYAACLAVVIGLVWHFYVPPVPEYKDALFSAGQLADLFPVKDTYGGTNVYTKENYPNESMFIVPELPEVEYLNVYQRNETVQPNEADLLALIEHVYPRVEEMYDIHIPDCGIALEDGYYRSGITEAGGKRIWASNGRYGLYASWCNADYSPLPIDGKVLSAGNAQTDDEIMESVSEVIPYLEQIFDLELSAYQIKRYYSSYGTDLNSLNIWLYTKDQVIDETLEQYDTYPVRCCTGDMICLEFGNFGNDKGDTVVCDQIRYYQSSQKLYKAYAQCRMISLKEAEVLLANGYVFADHVCPLCMAQQDKVDFSDYDRVSMEYVFGVDKGSYGIPFYTFYKKLTQREDGSVVYGKTMVPAIEVSGLKEYFEDQKKYHRAW
jgi:hypothetical protein